TDTVQRSQFCSDCCVRTDNSMMANEQEDEFIDKWFPDLQTETYFIPPVDLNPEAHVQQQIAGQTVLIPLDPRQHQEY
ncbi:hypothetical protein BaRGS_00015059, partial [Batillaria attramentaria]